MFYEETIQWIKDTPLGIRIRNIDFIPTHMHEDIIEFVFCLKGRVKFSYGFEEFTLSAGEFISVDKDAHFLYGETKDNICVSFYIDLNWYIEKYPFITSLLFVCEGTPESDRSHTTYHHKEMKGALSAILYHLANSNTAEGDFAEAIISGSDRIVRLLLDCFDITFYYNPELTCKEKLMERNREMQVYLHKHSADKITLEAMAKDFNLTKSYISEFLRTFEIGFRRSLSYIRANRSERLLLTTNMNIMDISEACGFSDPKYYYNAFKEWYKCTPGEFRKIYRDKMHRECSERELDLKDTLVPLNEIIVKHYLELFLF